MSNAATPKTVILIILLVLVVVVAIVGTVLFRTTANQVADIVITTPDLDNIEDGTYKGSFETQMVAATVAVNVKDHRIVAIDLLEHKTGRGKPAEVITAEVVAKQSLQVDTITGATASSQVILKAIEVALEQG